MASGFLRLATGCISSIFIAMPMPLLEPHFGCYGLARESRFRIHSYDLC